MREPRTARMCIDCGAIFIGSRRSRYCPTHVTARKRTAQVGRSGTNENVNTGWVLSPCDKRCISWDWCRANVWTTATLPCMPNMTIVCDTRADTVLSPEHSNFRILG